MTAGTIAGLKPYPASWIPSFFATFSLWSLRG